MSIKRYIYLFLFFIGYWPVCILASNNHPVQLTVPKGRLVGFAYYNHWQTNQYYDENGNKTSLQGTLGNTDLNSDLIPLLAPFGADATLGQPVFDAKFEAERMELALAYGITDDLTVAVVVPFGRTCSKVNIELNNANLGLNPFFDQTQVIDQSNFPLVPVIPGFIEPIDSLGLKALLTDPVFGFAFDNIGSSCHEGIGDPTVGLIWNFYKGKNSAATMSADLRVGLADKNRPHDLYDIPIDDSNDDLRLRVDYKHLFPGNWDFTTYLEYNIQTSDNITSRVPSDLSGIVGIDTTEHLKRNFGDYSQLDLEVGRTINDWRASVGMYLFDKSTDRYTSLRGQNTQFLELNTDSRDQQWHIGLRWLGQRYWKEKRLSSPVIVDFKYSQSYGGKNSAHLESAEFLLTVPF